ncbi:MULTISPECIES: hypothetical protein [Gammaproteobacteria]|uniref:hypothetical protein n=1 Tax=Gammaproteobacteria TaxID=1236 RepID=UPI001914165D|nr:MULTISPECIES: hypothetical protein [Gammaproteobacteria]MBK5304340.1 hypothetical protein [Bacillus sp. TH86]MBK5324109.1 hypothetical protein [Bacillus sp. TH59]MBK5339059.1 hypothetical protein [Bacillus sp. TH57]MBK5313108.1 hypothetical protein [Pseudomonas sp. TH71]MBK5318607.1 hypothetical protein [Erwinia sp. TH79]
MINTPRAITMAASASLSMERKVSTCIFTSIMTLALSLSGCDNTEINAPPKNKKKTNEEHELSQFYMQTALMHADKIQLVEEVVASGYCNSGCFDEVYFVLKNGYVSLDIKTRQIAILLKDNGVTGSENIGTKKNTVDYQAQQRPYYYAADPATLIPQLPYDLIKILLESGKLDSSSLNKNIGGVVSEFFRSDNKENQLSDDQTIELLQLAESHGVNISNPNYGGSAAWPDAALNYGKPKTFHFLIDKGCPIGKDYTYFSYTGLISKLGIQADPKLEIFRLIRKLGGNPKYRDGNGLNVPESAIYYNSNNQKLIINIFARAGVSVDKNRIKKSRDSWDDYISSRRKECAKLAERWDRTVIKGVITGHISESEDFRMPLYCREFQ